MSGSRNVKHATSYSQSDSHLYKTECDSNGNKVPPAGPDPISQYVGQSSYQIICGDSREIVHSLPQVQGTIITPPSVPAWDLPDAEMLDAYDKWVQRRNQIEMGGDS